MHADPLPASPEAVAAWLAELAPRRQIGIDRQERARGRPALYRSNRAIASVMAGIARTASRSIKRAAALELEDLRALIARIDGEDERSYRDRALLLVGILRRAQALRRSELVALDVGGNNVRRRSSIEVRREGLLVHLTATKASAATQAVRHSAPHR